MLTAQELRVLRPLKSPRRIQDFLETLPYNFDEGRDMLRSPRRVLRERTAHCIEGALLAAAALWANGARPLLLDLRSSDDDWDHVVTLFRLRGHWGAMSKTNYAVLRYRDPVYRSVRELAMSYFNEYFLENGRKTMLDYSDPYDVIRRHGTAWMTREDDLWDVAAALDASRHRSVVPASLRRVLRRVDPVERKAGFLKVWRR
jgi:hypothetical protein